jgi:hypothetical protein
MTPPILQIFWSNRFLFLFVMCLTFFVLAIGIFMLPARATVRSSIEIGSTAVYERQEPFDDPEVVAKRIPSVYGPAALLAMATKGISPRILGALEDLRAENIGHSVVMVSTIDPSFEKEAKEYQETIADLIAKELAPRSRALRENIATQLALAAKTFDDLGQQIKDDANEIERIGANIVDLRGQTEKQRQTLAALYQHSGGTLQPIESALVEAQIRELQDQISSQTNVVGNLTRERSDLARDLSATIRQRDLQSEAVADAQFRKNSFDETHISLPPTMAPSSNKRQLSLLLVASVVSLLAGFGTVVMSHNMGTREI